MKSKVEQYVNGISSIIKDGDRESRLIQESQEDGKTHFIFEVYEKNNLIERKEIVV